MHPLLQEIRHNRLLWLLAFVPVLLTAHAIGPDAHTLLFILSVLAIVPLAGLLSRATEAVAARTGDTIGGLLNATLGNLTESLQFWPGAVVMMLIAVMTASLVTNSGRSAWFVGVLVLMVYAILAMTLYLLPPRGTGEHGMSAPPKQVSSLPGLTRQSIILRESLLKNDGCAGQARA
jgi:Ca2+/H+ antiporter